MKCSVCRKEIEGEYFTANVDRNLKKTDKGESVCSIECAKDYEKKLVFQGKPIDRYSRITGYYQNVSGWNSGKLQELKDRKRYEMK